MLAKLTYSIPVGHPRYPIAYFRMMDTLSDRMTLARQKFVNASLPRTQGVELLRWMLLLCDLNHAKSFTDDSALYTEYLSGYQDSLRSSFDPAWSKSLSRGRFVKGQSGEQPTEIFLNCSLANPAEELPFGEDWPSWQNSLRAVTILSHNSSELPINMFTGYITFTKDVPSFVVIAINVPLLMMKWFKYNQWCEKNNLQADEEQFLKEEEYNEFFYDLQAIWINNLLVKMFTNSDKTVEQIVAELNVPSYITTENIIQNGVSAIKELIDLVKSRNLKMQDLLETDLLPDKLNVLDMIDYSASNYVLSDMRQYIWLKIMRDLPYLQMLVAIIDLDPTNPQYNPLIRKAYNLYVKMIKFAQLPNLQYSASIKTYVSVACKMFEKIFEGKVEAPLETTA